MEIAHGKAWLKDPAFSTVNEFLEPHFKKRPESPAIRYRVTPQSEVTTVSYRELERDLKALHKIYSELGWQGKRVGIIGDNSYVWMLSYLAQVTGLGLVVPLDRLLPSGEVLDLLERGKVEVLIYDMSFHRALFQNRRSSTPVEHWVAARAERAAAAERESFAADLKSKASELYYFDDLLEQGRKLVLEHGVTEFPAPDPDAPMSLLFTSGTSAAAKAVILTHRSVCANIRSMMMTVDFRPELKTLSLLPLHHSFENTCGFQTSLALGGCVSIYDGLRYISKNLKEYSPDLIVGVPTVFNMMKRRILSAIRKSGQEKKFKFALKLSAFLRFFGLDLRTRIFREIRAELGGRLYIGINGAAPIDPEVQRFFDQIGVSLLQGYGMTECSPVITGTREEDLRFGSVGYPLALVSLAIDNERPGEPGEILVKSPIVMKEYYEDEAANQEAFTADGWFKTGDIGYLEDGKYLYLSGRSKSMIVLQSGKKVFPEELEELLNAYDYVKDSMVFGQKDNKGDVVLTAKIVLDRDKLEAEGRGEADSASILEWLDKMIATVNAKLPTFKGIRSYFYSFKDLITTTTLKIKRAEEMARIESLLAALNLSWSDLSGCNIDSLEAKLLNPVEDALGGSSPLQQG
ncbi:MAG: AMP-binding protein [Eubacteriales bacterium]|nr:AMP-binding protein [Eubacteriales bacterium]